MNVGIITYHAAYNYGSALQAYATLAAVKKLEIPVKVINYRPAEQKRFYQPLVRTNYGVKTFVKDFQMLPCFKNRNIRKERFEQFFCNYFDLTEEITLLEDVEVCFKQFDTLISGSDQILNKHSCELENVGWEYMNPYLLKGFEGRKISYASSIANMTNEELTYISSELKQFQHISLRESSSIEQLSSLLGRELTYVSDPTFLLNAQEWKDTMHISEGEEHILYYSLRSIKIQKDRKKELEHLAEVEKCKVIVVTPFSAPFSSNSSFDYHYEYGPIEFLEAIAKSKMVVTDSYHGTILSVNLGKSVYSICENVGSEFRKTDILTYLGLNARVIGRIGEINPNAIHPNDERVQKKLSDFRNSSMSYLRNSLS